MESIPLEALPLSDGVIRLRLFAPADAQAVAAACEDPDIPRWTFMQEGLTVDGALEWIRQSDEQITNGSNVRVAIDRPSRRELLGQVGVGHLDWMNATGEVYYWLAAEARGQGYATRAVRLITRWAFDALELQRVYLFVDPENVASQDVATRAGFEREGRLRSHQVFKGRRMDSVVFSRLPADP